MIINYLGMVLWNVERKSQKTEIEMISYRIKSDENAIRKIASIFRVGKPLNRMVLKQNVARALLKGNKSNVIAMCYNCLHLCIV